MKVTALLLLCCCYQQQVDALLVRPTTQLVGLRSSVSSSNTITTTATTTTRSTSTSTSTTTTLWMAKSRKARRQERDEKQSKGRSQQFYEAIEEARRNNSKNKKDGDTMMNGEGGGGGGDKNNNQSSSTTTALMKDQQPSTTSSDRDDDDDGKKKKKLSDGGRSAQMEEAKRRMDARPDVSSVIVDEETGTEIIVQGRNVMDVVTRKAVKLSDMGPQYRLAQMFPGVPDDIRAKYRFKDWKTITVPEMLEQLKAACEVKLDDQGTRGIPPHPSVANKAIDFMVANRDLLGPKMRRTIGRFTLNAAWRGDKDGALKMRKLWKNYHTLENHISAPFRQILVDAEGRVGPNFGNLDLMSFCNGDLYERIGNYILLKGMVAHWEKKVVDADFIENTPPGENSFIRLLTRGDPRRFLAEPPILYTLRDCTQVCAMAQRMCNQFVETEELFGDFPPEIVFLEDALKIRGGTALRKYMIEEFCPARGITPEGLREGMRRLCYQLDNLPIDPYADLTNKVQKLCYAMAVGTDDAIDPYDYYLGMTNLQKDNPAYFETYTYNYPSTSIVTFLDNQYPSAGLGIDTLIGPNPSGAGTSSSGAIERDSSYMNAMDGFFKAGGDNPIESLFGEFGSFIGGLGIGDSKPLRTEPPTEVIEPVSRIPKERSLGRQHEQGWFDVLKAPEGEARRMGDVPIGRIIPDDE